MTRRLRVEWRPGRKVTALLEIPDDRDEHAVLIAHGAGAGQRHPFIVGLRRRLVAAGIPVMTFDYPYMEAGRRAPDRLDALLACHRAAALRLQDYVPSIVLAGKSMGGRVATHLAAEGQPCAGIVVYGYPLVPLGKSEPRSVDHLSEIHVPAVFLQGTRDRLAPLEAVERAFAGTPVEVVLVEDADHSFKVPKRSGLDAEDILDRLASETIALVQRLGGGA